MNGVRWVFVRPTPRGLVQVTGSPPLKIEFNCVEGRFQQLCSLRLSSPSSSCPSGLRAGRFALLKPGQPFNKPSLSHPVDTCCLFTVGTLSYLGPALVRERQELSSGVTARTLGSPETSSLSPRALPPEARVSSCISSF